MTQAMQMLLLGLPLAMLSKKHSDHMAYNSEVTNAVSKVTASNSLLVLGQMRCLTGVEYGSYGDAYIGIIFLFDSLLIDQVVVFIEMTVKPIQRRGSGWRIQALGSSLWVF